MAAWRVFSVLTAGVALAWSTGMTRRSLLTALTLAAVASACSAPSGTIGRSAGTTKPATSSKKGSGDKTTTTGESTGTGDGTETGAPGDDDETASAGPSTSTPSTSTTKPTDPGTTTTAPVCVDRRLKFSADDLPAVPSGAFVWGGNATGGEQFLNPPYAPDFLARAADAHRAGLPVFAYLEGPCGDTDGVDDGEVARCAVIHRAYNRQFAPGTPDTAVARWKPFTMKQLTTSGANKVDYCEIDNLSNNVTIPLNSLLKEIKGLYDTGKIHCRLVLKNVEASAIDAIRRDVAPTVAAAEFIAPFHIFEADDTSEKAGLDAAMKRLKGAGAVTIISTDTNHYGSEFTPDVFKACD